jgi:fatty acid desaturase
MESMTKSEKVSWQRIVAAYSKPDLRKSLWQTANTLIPFFALFYLTMRSVDISLWLTVPLALLTAGFMVRTFIIFHDCGHGSFFASQRANNLLGIITGILTFTPYYRWKHDHAVHHATSGHGSFFKSQRANDLLGIVTGILTFTPYYRWKHDHAVHHAATSTAAAKATCTP